jgi:hypothetical protein
LNVLAGKAFVSALSGRADDRWMVGSGLVSDVVGAGSLVSMPNWRVSKKGKSNVDILTQKRPSISLNVGCKLESMVRALALDRALRAVGDFNIVNFWHRRPKVTGQRPFHAENGDGGCPTNIVRHTPSVEEDRRGY